MSDTFLNREPIEELAEQFVDRLREGRAPSIEQYAEEHPQLADRIRRLFPKLVLMEKVSPGDNELAAATQTDIELDTQLGDFLLIREIGRGGMGVVYEALQQSLGRRVAVKVLMSDPLNLARRRLRFQREARAAARLHHTNIVPVYGVGQHEQACFYVMQYIDGQGLHDIVRELRRIREQERADASSTETSPSRSSAPATAASSHSLTDVAQSLLARQSPDRAASGSGDASGSAAANTAATTAASSGSNSHYWKSVANIGVQVAEALQYAHDHGTFHRDIKPANILLDSSGTVWVTDFGLAKVAWDDELTRDGDVVGTLRYMAPEQFDSRCDHRSDIYSLGLTMYELMTLQAAYDEPKFDRPRRDLTPRPRKVDPKIPADLETIVLKASAAEPERRYETAGQLADDLRRFLADRPIEARRVSALEHGWRWCRRNPLVAGLGTAVALLLVTVVATSITLAFRFQAEKRLAIENAHLAEENTLRALDVAFASARSPHTSRQPGHRGETWNAVTRAAELLPIAPLPHTQKSDIRRRLRDEAIATLTSVDLELQEDWDYDASPLGFIRAGFDSKIERYARQEEDGQVVMRRLVDNAILRRFDRFDVENELRVYVRFSSDDQLLAARGPIEGKLRVRVWEIDSGERLLDVRAAGRTYHSSFDFSADSKSLAVYGHRDRVDLWDLDSGKRIGGIPIAHAPYFVRFGPDGHRLALGAGTGNAVPGDVLIVDRRQPDRPLRLPHPDFVSDAAWSPDGRWLATPCYDYQVRVWNTSSGDLHSVCDGHRGKPRHVVFHPYGTLLMSTAWDSTTRLWNPQTGRELLRSTDRGIAFSQDARWLGSERPASVGVRRWHVANADVCRTLYGHHSDAYVISLAFDPSGAVLASGSGRDGVRLWDVRRGRELSHLVQEYASGVAFIDEPCRLVTSSVSALQMWPIQLTGAATGATLRCGPATILDTVDPRRVSAGDNALLVGSADIWARLYRDEGVMRIGPLDHGHRENHKFLAVSPDGKWAATSGKKAAGVTIWDLDSQAAIGELEVGPARISFSPDGKQLIASAFQQYIGWDVETWREQWRLSHDGPGYGCVAFTADMRLMATTASHRVILRDGSHRTELATLSAPDPELLSTAHPEGTAALCFCPNGGLLAVGTQGGKIRLWDTSAIRRNLAEIDLDWSDDPQPAEKSHNGTAMKINLIDRENR